jgi:hypothetical protein
MTHRTNTMLEVAQLRLLAGARIFVPLLMLFVTANSISPIPAGVRSVPPIFCETNACEKQKSILRQLERTRPGKKLTRDQIFRRIRSTCGKMRALNCPDLKNYRPSICFTDF